MRDRDEIESVHRDLYGHWIGGGRDRPLRSTVWDDDDRSLNIDKAIYNLGGVAPGLQTVEFGIVNGGRKRRRITEDSDYF